MLDHVSITVSDIPAAERFYDAIMKALDVVKVGRREDRLGYGERARPVHPAGGADEGRPGLRDYHAAYYGAFLRDPDGNRVEAACHLAP
jgi:catechol 2,3-dioxygenase-like lactoylglutathione lyase family enzyme